jgi:hypothetical protein
MTASLRRRCPPPALCASRHGGSHPPQSQKRAVVLPPHKYGDSLSWSEAVWLKVPVDHFPVQVDGDPADDGVCGIFIAEKLGAKAAHRQ